MHSLGSPRSACSTPRSPAQPRPPNALASYLPGEKEERSPAGGLLLKGEKEGRPPAVRPLVLPPRPASAAEHRIDVRLRKPPWVVAKFCKFRGKNSLVFGCIGTDLCK